MSNASRKLAVVPAEDQEAKKPSVPPGQKPMEDHLYGLHARPLSDLVENLDGRKKRTLTPPDFPDATRDHVNWGSMGSILKSLWKRKE